MSPSNRDACDVSIIMTAHAEGRLAHRSVKSVLRAIEVARERGIKSEFVVILDAPCQETRDYFDEQREAFDSITIVELHDPGLSRNHGAPIANGRYLAFIDADDLFCHNWIAAAYEFAARCDESTLVLHPELTLWFGRRVELFRHSDSTDPNFSPLNLIRHNLWTSANFVGRKFFLDGNLYAATNPLDGFGFEDWHWNCESIANEAVHRVVPETVHFVRLKTSNSRNEQATRAGVVFLPTRLFDNFTEHSFHRQCQNVMNGSGTYSNVHGVFAAQSLDHPEHDAPRHLSASPHSLKQQLPDKYRLRHHLYISLRTIHHTAMSRTWSLLNDRPKLRAFWEETANATGKLLKSRPNPSLPEWLIKEWHLIHNIEPELFPSAEILANPAWFEMPDSSAVKLYPQVEALAGSSPTHIFLLPWLIRGGADLEAMFYMRAVVEESPGNRVVCITTENRKSSLLDQLPKEIRIVELGNLLADYTEADKEMLLLRLLLQKQPRVIHNINSHLGYKLFVNNGHSLTARSSLYATLFAEEVYPDGRVGGYAFGELPRCIHHLSKVFTDNRRLVNKLYDTYALEKPKFAVVYCPAPQRVEIPTVKTSGDVLHILWASRFDREKRPDVLLQIALKAATLPVHFHVYGAPLLDQLGLKALELLRELPNVTTNGEYRGFNSIPIENYDLFLYTSERDGLPNVLLEAASARLPTLAPDVGGINEFINDETGFLVSRADAVDEYVDYIKAVLDDRSLAFAKLAAAQRLLGARHTWSSFVATLRQTPGYL